MSANNLHATGHRGASRRSAVLPRSEAIIGLVVGGIVFVVYLSTLAPGLTWANRGADGGDLISAAATLGIAHPSGYPTYLLLARLFLALPAGSPAFRTNLLSATCAALASVVVVRLVSRSYAGPRRYAQAGGLVAGLAFGLSPVLWSQAVITEVYTLHALFTALILYTLPMGGLVATHAAGRRNYLAGLLFGVALGNHLTTVLLMPPWLLLAVRPEAGGRWQVRALAERLAGLVTGLLVYVYLPLRASAHPPVNWGNPVDLAGFWWVVSGVPYRALVFGLPSGYVLNRIQGWAGLILAQFGLLGMGVAFYGLFFGRANSSRLKAVTVWSAAVFSIFAIGYNTVDSYAYLLPAFLAMAVWLGLGLATALAGLQGFRARGPGRLILASGLVLALAFNAVVQTPGVDASQATAAETFGRAVMAKAPPGGLIFTHGDQDSFAAWYFQIVLRQRPDLAIVVEPLLAFDWYRENLAATYPGLAMPAIPAQPAASWRQALSQANRRPVCDTSPDAAEVLTCQPFP